MSYLNLYTYPILSVPLVVAEKLFRNVSSALRSQYNNIHGLFERKIRVCSSVNERQLQSTIWKFREQSSSGRVRFRSLTNHCLIIVRVFLCCERTICSCETINVVALTRHYLNTWQNFARTVWLCCWLAVALLK